MTTMIVATKSLMETSARCLTVVLLLSLSAAQLMRRDSTRAASRRSRLQGALREALAKVAAERVLFVEDRGDLGGTTWGGLTPWGF